MTPAVFLTILCLGVASAAPALDPSLDDKWQEWKMKYEKSYSSLEEEAQKRGVWEENMKMVKMHNEENGLGKNGFTMKMNAFGDMTHKEYRKMMTDVPVPAAMNVKSNEKGLSDFPKFKDWRKEGYVTPVRDQGNCSSCWAFAAAGAIEGQMFWKTGKLTPLSVQNLLDCSKPQGNVGCEHGSAYNALRYVSDNKGLEAESTYPYEGKDGPCRYNPENSKAYVTEAVPISPNENYLLVAVAFIGPIAAAIDASHDSFRFYNGGIYHEPNCSSYLVNHSVLVVGYGFEGNETDGNNYWLIKNSWGEEWGIKGYMKIAKDRNNHCSIASQASFPNIF